MDTHSVLTSAQGVILYDGPSALDGKPIVAIATGLKHPSANRKTGPMVQTFILRADVPPVEAIKCGADASVCGDCPHRKANRGSCYVNVGQSPSSVWHAYKRGVYPELTKAGLGFFRGRAVRFGAYGDPVAVPYRVWASIVRVAGRWTGYTHQWHRCSWHYRRFLMASCDSPDEQQTATGRGWRTFRVRTVAEPIQSGEFVCPASDEGSKRTTCERCCACNGTRMDARRSAGSPVIVVHGATAGRFEGAA